MASRTQRARQNLAALRRLQTEERRTNAHDFSASRPVACPVYPIDLGGRPVSAPEIPELPRLRVSFGMSLAALGGEAGEGVVVPAHVSFSAVPAMSVCASGGSVSDGSVLNGFPSAAFL